MGTPFQPKISSMKSPPELQQILAIDGDLKHSRSLVQEFGLVKQDDECSKKEPKHWSEEKLELFYQNKCTIDEGLAPLESNHLMP